VKKPIRTILDILLFPFVYLAACLMKFIRYRKLPLSRKALLQVGVFPILNHYYEPLFDSRNLRYPLDQERELPGIDWNTGDQLELLAMLNFSNELNDLKNIRTEQNVFYFNNGAFESGDAEYFYNLIRLKKPGRIIEIGSGFSTLIAEKAIKCNQKENPAYTPQHVCIEPFEMVWLEKSGVTVIRQRVEELDKSLFLSLENNDILFIDSSHMIRPQGDVLFEYLEVIPALKAGVIVHVHDIFSPRDYPKEWVTENVRFWNEQYLLEAFLTCNHEWKIIGALNFLHHNHFEKLSSICPFLTPEREPGSFYIQKII
jgi:hypothetical protein